MKFDFTCEQGDDGVYITNIIPNEELKMPLPCKAISINEQNITSCEQFYQIYKQAAEGNHRFFLLIQKGSQKQYFNLPITE